MTNGRFSLRTCPMTRRVKSSLCGFAPNNWYDHLEDVIGDSHAQQLDRCPFICQPVANRLCHPLEVGTRTLTVGTQT